MSNIEQVKKLRDETGVSIMQCKKALDEVDGDMEKAKMILKKKSSDAAAKKSDRELGSGLVVIKEDGAKTCILGIYCETDFVAKNEDFVNLANELTNDALSNGIESIKSESEEKINTIIQKVGENIQLGDVEIYEEGVVGSYVHNGIVGAVVTLEGGSKELARDIAMHITAMKPAFLTEEEIPEDAKTRAHELFSKAVEEEAGDKPEEIKVKILEGKINSYFKEQILLKQSFIKDPSKTIEQLAKEGGATIKSFNIQQI